MILVKIGSVVKEMSEVNRQRTLADGLLVYQNSSIHLEQNQNIFTGDTRKDKHSFR